MCKLTFEDFKSFSHSRPLRLHGACDMAPQWDILHQVRHIVLSRVHSVRTSQYSITSKANLTAPSNKTCLSLPFCSAHKGKQEQKKASIQLFATRARLLLCKKWQSQQHLPLREMRKPVALAAGPVASPQMNFTLLLGESWLRALL